MALLCATHMSDDWGRVLEAFGERQLNKVVLGVLNSGDWRANFHRTGGGGLGGSVGGLLVLWGLCRLSGVHAILARGGFGALPSYHRTLYMCPGGECAASVREAVREEERSAESRDMRQAVRK